MNTPSNLFTRWISEIESYDFEVIHHPGRLLSNANTLSMNLQEGDDSLLEISVQMFCQLQNED